MIRTDQAPNYARLADAARMLLTLRDQHGYLGDEHDPHAEAALTGACHIFAALYDWNLNQQDAITLAETIVAATDGTNDPSRTAYVPPC